MQKYIYNSKVPHKNKKSHRIFYRNHNFFFFLFFCCLGKSPSSLISDKMTTFVLRLQPTRREIFVRLSMTTVDKSNINPRINQILRGLNHFGYNVRLQY